MNIMIRLLRSLQALQATVKGIRNSRVDYGVEPGRKIAAQLHVEDPALRFACHMPLFDLLGAGHIQLALGCIYLNTTKVAAMIQTPNVLTP